MENLHSDSLLLENNILKILDQTQLPFKEEWLECHQANQLFSYIQDLKIRGAPLIGISATLFAALSLEKGKSILEVQEICKYLRTSRPTAVNLNNNLDQFLKALSISKSCAQIKAQELFNQEKKMCDELGQKGAPLVKAGSKILTYCNTGSLATIGIGTAIGVIKKAYEKYKDILVYVSETRPLLQGGRLTAWEMNKYQIPHKIICDNMAGYLMQKSNIDLIIVGADRIAKNGDVANKIGTYTLAALANFHNIPFYVAAPSTTYDPKSLNGDSIEIEQRKSSEVRGYSCKSGSLQWALDASEVYNPAFDTTPSALVSGYIFPDGVLKPNEFDKIKL